MKKELTQMASTNTPTRPKPPPQPTRPDPKLVSKTPRELRADKKTAKLEQKQQKQAEKDNKKKHKHPTERYIVEAAVIIAVVSLLLIGGVVVYFMHQRGLDERESTRNTAKQVLQARFTDASIDPPIEVVSVEWNGDDLAVTYVRGKQTCFGKVILPTDGQQYGIAEIGDVYPAERASKKYYCSTVSSSDGLSPLPATSTTTSAPQGNKDNN